ncbi:unnamed protein product [Strongylus vulgaris]|uniref:Uncharacterized protein n=1 Tax=Strongylus vulgaris TaxID=40348 RepID=A0A3P7HZW5_STRVU|nr:unnamed protein product [Strongylus vulgaris]
MLRKVTTGHSLLDVALQFRLSLDVESERLINVRFRVEDPTVDLSSGVFAAFVKQTSPVESSSPQEVTEESGRQQALPFLANLSDLSVEMNNCLIKYNGALGQESRTMSLSLRGLSLSKNGEKGRARVSGLTVEDQGQRLALRTSLIVLSQEVHQSGINVQVSSDSVQTKLSIEDVVWWKMHAEDHVISLVGRRVGPSKSVPQHSLPIIFAIELASISCDLVDLDSFQSILSMQYLSVIKTAEVLEVGVDCLCISAPNVDITNATFEHHQWNHSVYVGAALVQCNLSDNARGILVGVDDCKIEWSDKLAYQVKQLLEVLAASEPHSEKDDLSKKKINLRLQMKRRKYERAAAWDERRKNNPFLCFETNVLCLTVEILSPLITSVTCSSSSPIYIVWSPLLHRIIYHMSQVIMRTFQQPKSGNGSLQKSRKQTQYRVLTNHAIELILELPRHHRMVWRIPSLTFDASPSSLSAVSPKLVMTMDSMDIITAIDVCITRRISDMQMDSYRRGFKEFEALTNKVWTWSAASFHFFLPFEFSFAQVFDEFVNAIKWIKVVHGLKKDPFPPNAPLPSDIRVIFKEARIVLEDDPFESLLQMSHELKEDEVRIR